MNINEYYSIQFNFHSWDISSEKLKKGAKPISHNEIYEIIYIIQNLSMLKSKFFLTILISSNSESFFFSIKF